MKKWLLVLLGGWLTVSGAEAADANSTNFFIHDGDHPLVFLGDSITEQQHYTRLIESYVYSRFPKWNVSFRNLGWGGDTVTLVQHGFLDQAMKRDIDPVKPVAMTIDFGMNDARGGEAGVKTYILHYTNLLARLRAENVRVAVLTPSPEERFETNGPAGSPYNNVLQKFSDAAKMIAEKEGLPFVDQFTPFVKAIEEGRKAGVLGMDGKPRLIPDGVHPNIAGHWIMATSILKGLHAPALVSRVTIDAGRKQASDAQGCRVEWVAGQELAFRRTDDALPWPVPEDAQFVLKIPGFHPLEDLDRFELQVKNAQAPAYELFIDDVGVGVFSNQQLAAGVNVALKAGPITDQAMKLWRLITEKNTLFGQRWSRVQIAALPAWVNGPEVEKLRTAEMARMDGLIAAKEKEIDDARQPVPHVWKLVAATAKP